MFNYFDYNQSTANKDVYFNEPIICRYPNNSTNNSSSASNSSPNSSYNDNYTYNNGPKKINFSDKVNHNGANVTKRDLQKRKASIEDMPVKYVKLMDTTILLNTTYEKHKNSENALTLNSELIRRINNGTISLDEMMSILNLSGDEVVDFIGARCVEINQISFGDQKEINDFGFLKHFPNLKGLSFINYTLNDLNFVQDCPNLENLVLHECTVKSYNLTQIHPNLKNIQVFTKDLTDFSFLKYFPNLLKADIGFGYMPGQKTSIDFGFLSECPNIETLKVGSCENAINLHNLQQCENLKNLSVQGKQSIIVEFLKNCTKNLQNIEIGCGAIRNNDLEILQKYTHLQSLKLYAVHTLENLSALLLCQNLKDLLLSHCRDFPANQKKALLDKGVTIQEKQFSRFA
jgi:hypothetical protein